MQEETNPDIPPRQCVTPPSSSPWESRLSSFSKDDLKQLLIYAMRRALPDLAVNPTPPDSPTQESHMIVDAGNRKAAVPEMSICGPPNTPASNLDDPRPVPDMDLKQLLVKLVEYSSTTEAPKPDAAVIEDNPDSERAVKPRVSELAFKTVEERYVLYNSICERV